MHLTTHHEVLLIVFLTAVVLGAVANKTNFCTMGAVSDWVNMGDTGRLRAWIFAIAIAMAGVLLLESTGVIKIPIGSGTFPPYRTPNFAWLRYVLGGFLFGIGMTLGSGCGNKTLIRVGAGNIKSLVVLVFAAAVAYAMLWTDFFGLYIFPAVQATTIDLARHGIDSQQLGTLVGGLFGASASGTLNVVGDRWFPGGALDRGRPVLGRTAQPRGGAVVYLYQSHG
ncbi:MAG: YeeE/YedE thiosulfate transporter family protein [Acidiferrobacteraceae bacterium]